MIATARSVVALVDSSKFGKVDLTPIARTEQISHMMTDSDLPAHWVEQLRQTCIVLTVCDEATTSSYTPWAIAAGHYRIGFASLGEQVPFATEVRRGIERAAAEAGNVDLFLADNQLDGKIALQVADHLLQRELDLVIEFQLDARAGDVLMAKFRQAGVPVIAVDIPMVGATFFGADNYTSGEMAGTALGAWIREHWGGEMDELIVLEEARAGLLPGARIRGQMDGLQSQVGVIPVEIIRHVDSSNTAEYTESRHRSGAIAHDGLGLEMVIVGQGADRRARAEMRRPGSPLIGSTAFRPEKYGDGLIALARSILRREPVPPATYVDHVFITPYNVDGYYPEA